MGNDPNDELTSDEILTLVEQFETLQEYDTAQALRLLLPSLLFLESELDRYKDSSWKTRFLHAVELVKEFEWIVDLNTRAVGDWYFCPACAATAKKKTDGEWTKKNPARHQVHCPIFMFLCQPYTLSV